jgi:hypothetical protein
MAETTKVLGQSDPAEATLTDLYTVPGATSAVTSTLTVANRTGAAILMRVSVAPAGAADSVEQYILYDVLVGAADTYMATVGLTLEATDVVRVYGFTVGLSFNLFGVEIT